MTPTSLFTALRTAIQALSGDTKAALATLAELEDEVRAIDARSADNMAQRHGEMLRTALTPGQYYQAERDARLVAPELWAGRLPMADGAQAIIATGEVLLIDEEATP